MALPLITTGITRAVSSGGIFFACNTGGLESGGSCKNKALFQSFIVWLNLTLSLFSNNCIALWAAAVPNYQLGTLGTTMARGLQGLRAPKAQGPPRPPTEHKAWGPQGLGTPNAPGLQRLGAPKARETPRHGGSQGSRPQDYDVPQSSGSPPRLFGRQGSVAPRLGGPQSSGAHRA
jgi:hypothetical protein